MVLRKHELEGKLGEESAMIKSGVLRDENPLDQSEGFDEFLLACRHGDLRRCQELIGRGVNINGKDRFDYTPLIIASLCGHYELVQLLLDSGALAERNTFQGERCIYNALNDRIRNLLLQYDFSKSSDPYVYWSAHVSSLLTRSAPSTSDMSLTSGSRTFNLHRFLLASRTPYFRTKLEAQPETPSWHLASTVPVEAVQIVLRYLYLGDLPRDLVPPGSRASEEDVVRGLDKISKQLEVEHLWEAIMATSDRRLARQRRQEEEQRALKQVGDFFRAKVLGNKMVVDTARVHDTRWKLGNAAFADVLLRADEPPAPGAGRRPRKSALYPVHKAMLIRSGYFDRMFSGSFVESRRSEDLRVVTVDCAPPVLELVLAFLYTESTACPLQHALDLLYTADMLLLDTLKNKAAQAISTLGSATSNVLVDRTHRHTNGQANGTRHAERQAEMVEAEPINIYNVIHAAWDLGVQRLEEFAARYLATRLEDYIDDPDFQELIRESAARIQRREETDTIELLDDIRFYLSERFRLRFEDAGLDDMMMDQDGKIDVEAAVSSPERGDVVVTGHGARSGAENDGVVETLHGDMAEDEFVSDAINYQILLGKIDAMLERLKLDA
ncbi:ankyrin repeat and BTB/POZ domain-containing protein 1 [Metarhizium album ARSEF 1941]|uniref:Ankyrin repeat and BTB/POZ domain-containing protein 1 n=1 Tax=Metarhizium album (strain ARSEF 1941) TaxID=1081103 RepID=A0A0B2X6K6_METAS|nr:ankyrin repeat and BTB/POZ domain-containing protein 1 [Metarhizium album ARSEF 1941]KHO01383.1 ankyrin repeat and BTB/POZ domain-containing protein 1 [Metarhizium album ARSEF 1941]